MIVRTPSGQLETITITVAANAKASRVAKLAKEIRRILEHTITAEEPLIIERFRDYAITTEVKP
jgi:small-conductance mechanosensitive channel